MQETATVEVLTAEVQVMTINSRQVTKSIWSQLDYIDPFWIEPWGRVEPDTTSGMVSIVGRDRRTGALVRARVRKPIVSPHDTTEYDRDMIESYEFAKELPLIVLAGLR